MSEKVITSESELYNHIVEMLSNGNFLQLNGKAISLTELNEYINAKQEEIERQKEIIRQLDIKNLELTTIIKEVRERVLNENKPLPSAREIIEILDKVDKENNNEK